MDKYDMTSLFCNLLDNAVEAATGYPNAFIEIYADFSKSHNSLLLSVKNSCMQKPSINTKGRLKTQKFPNGIHGTGLKSVLRVVKKYEGNYEFSYDDQEPRLSLPAVTLTNSKKRKNPE
ncbi:MAG: ATP-binding protein [Sellimonas intestinalis]